MCVCVCAGAWEIWERLSVRAKRERESERSLIIKIGQDGREGE